MADNYELLALLGTGTFGDAWVAKSKKHDKKQCVVKIINILRLSEREFDQALTEVSVLGRMNHVNIVQYLDAYVHNGALNIAMEYADGGDLHKKICDQNGVFFTKEVVMGWFAQICKALQYIHRQNILHRDLKSQNIFLTSKSIIKVGDFGIARILKNSSDLAATTIGTPFYLSPEICQKRPYNHKSDIWALGCVLYEMCCLCVPFDGDSLQELILKILHEQFRAIPRCFGSTLDFLVRKLLDKAPENRPSADSILGMAFLQPYTKQDYSKTLLKERRCSLPNTTPRLQKNEKGLEDNMHPFDKENMDQSFAGRTYLVKSPKFINKKLGSTPNVSIIVAKQRKGDHVKLKKEAQNEVVENPRTRLFSGGQDKSLLKISAESELATQNGDDNNDSNDTNTHCNDGITTNEYLKQNDRQHVQIGKTKLSQNMSKPPSGRHGSFDSKPDSSCSIKKSERFPEQGLKEVDRIRKSTGRTDGENGDLLISDASRKSRLKSLSTEQGPFRNRQAPIETDILNDTMVLPSRSYVLSSPCCKNELARFDADDDVFWEQEVKNDKEPSKNFVSVERSSYEKIRRSSSYDCVYVNKQKIQVNENINRAMSAGSISAKRFTKDAHTYKVESLRVPAGPRKSDTYAVQTDLQLNVDPIKTVYNCMCQCIQDSYQGQKLLYSTIVKDIGQGDADSCIKKVSQCMLEKVNYQDIKSFIPSQNQSVLPVVLIYILLTKFWK